MDQQGPVHTLIQWGELDADYRALWNVDDVEMGEGKPTVLVVDDEVFNLEILCEHLEDAGYEPVSAENRTQAWSLLEETPDRFEAVLLDRMVPEMDGMEVLTRIKAHSTFNSLPVIMQTAKATIPMVEALGQINPPFVDMDTDE